MPSPSEQVANLKRAFAENDIPWPNDKTKRTIVGKQVIEPHHLAQFGYRRMPHRLWRVSPRAWVIASALQDIWLIAIGRCTLHRAWQAGYDRHCSEEFGRRLRGGQ